jgi:deazaflavin-dependent oxidoreductase (nitroreductase family)
MFPRRLAQVNRRVTNPLLRPLARILPPFAVIEHRGRATGRIRWTPVFAFRRPGEIVIVLSYGRRSEWVRNLQVSGGGVVIRRGRRFTLANPRVRPVAECGALSPLGRFSTRFADDVLVADLIGRVESK